MLIKLNNLHSKINNKKVNSDDKEKYLQQFQKIQEIDQFILNFQDFIDYNKWEERYEMSYDKFLKICKDPCWQYFLNLEKKQNAVCKSNKVVNDEGQKFSERMIHPNYEVY